MLDIINKQLVKFVWLFSFFFLSAQAFSQVDSIANNPDQLPDAELPTQEGIPSNVRVVEPRVDSLKFGGDQIQENTRTRNANAAPAVEKDTVITYPPVGIYGHDFLRTSNFTLYTKAKQSKIEDNYILGPGDELVVSVWDDDAAITELLILSDDGFVQGDKVGRINLAGMELGLAKSVVKAKYASFFDFRKSNFDLVISEAKVINVEVVGDVEKPGTYSISATNKLLTVLMQSGGPTKNGSVRNITVKRDGKVVNVLDLYKYLDTSSTGDGNIYLTNNDVIVIPSIGPLVAIEGPVKKATSFELKPRETFSNLLNYAGGFEPNAVKNKFQVLRYGEQDYNLLDFPYSASATSETLIDGDLVRISTIPARAENVVSIAGAVYRPGPYQYDDEMRVTDLVEKAGNLRFDALSNRAFIQRKNDRLETINIPVDLDKALENPGGTDDVLVYPRDLLTIFAKGRITETYSVEIFGEVKEPGVYTFVNDLTIEDLILLAGGFNPQALNTEVEISRVLEFKEESGQLLPVRSTREKIPVDFSAFEDRKGDQMLLTPYDQIFVRKVPEFEFPETVLIEGEVVYPGSYPLTSKDMRVKDLIDQAGGLTPYAFAEGAKLFRGTEGLIETKLTDIQRRESSKYNYVLKPGDRLEIPTVDEVVTIEGAIRNVLDDQQLINTAFRGNKNAKWYIDNYGAGFDKGALRRSTQVVDPNGRLKGTKKFLFFNVYPDVSPGSNINVAYKPEKPVQEDGKNFFGDLTIEKTLALIASVASTVALINATR